MGEDRNIKLYALTLDCKDPHELAKFYAALLQWDIPFFDGDFACVGVPGAQQGAYPGLLFQKTPAYEWPVWPSAPDAQQQMAHIDFAVKDLDAAARHAVHCGAVLADEQFSDGWRVLFDPEGHPFCLCQMTALFESGQLQLR